MTANDMSEQDMLRQRLSEDSPGGDPPSTKESTRRYRPSEAGEEAVFALIASTADRAYTMDEIVAEADVSRAEAVAAVWRMVEAGVLRETPPEESGENWSFYTTEYEYLTDEALKEVPGEFLRDMADSGDMRAQKTIEELVAESEARPGREKAQVEIEAALSTVQHIGRGDVGRSQLETVKEQLLRALGYVDEAIVEVEDVE